MAKPIRKWSAADRRPLKVNVSEAEDIKEASTEDIIDETPVDTVEENNPETVETVEEVNTPVEEKPEEKTSSVKEWTEEELVILPREEFYKVIADIKAGKAKCKQRIINK